ncbi:MAG: DNA polymerase I [Candidatus Saccharimonadales bacterium]
MADTARKKLAIIDGKSVFYRGYYAMPNLSTKDGTPTGGVYGFAAMSLELLKRLKPDYVAVAWDKPKTNIRKRLELYPQYKAGRKPAPPDFYVQIPILHDLLKAFSWPLYELDDYEADDIMCTLAKKADKAGLETMLITSDLDALQCIGQHSHVYVLKKGFSNIERFDIEYFEQKHGIEVEQFLDLKSLKGDSSDNIPGVPGVGEKTAVQLLQDYKTLDNIYDNLALIKETTRKKLEAGKESAYLSKQVALLMDDAPVDLDLQATDTRDLDVHALKSLLTNLEFRSLLRQLPEYMQVLDNSEAPVHKVTAGAIEPLKTELVIMNGALKAIKIQDEMVLHSYASGQHGRGAETIVLADDKTAYVLDLKALDKKAVAAKLGELKNVIGYDLKASLKVLLDLGVELPKVSHDVLVGAFLINSIRRVTTLTELAFADLGHETASLDALNSEELHKRAGELVAVIKALQNYQAESMSELTKLITLSDQVEWPVIPVLARMEYEGIGLDAGYLAKMGDELADKISDIEQTIYGHADQEFNISSPGQLSEILFEKLQLPTSSTQAKLTHGYEGQPWNVKKGKAGHFSTASDVLNKLRALHPIIDCIEQYREYTKLKSTYVDTLPKQMDENGRVHTNFRMTIAPTGRLSSNEPNLQNIPVRTELGKKIRTGFVARPGHVFVSADYSQFEIRLAAALSGDEDMIRAFNEDQDVHVLTAAAVLNIDPEEVTKQMRYNAKAVNFGIMYGQGPHGLAEGTGMSFAEARDFIAKYFMIRPKLKLYIESLREQALKKGYVETILGRRRPTPDVKSSNFMVREGAYRQAINMPIQGSAADLTKLAMVRLQQKFDQTFAEKAERSKKKGSEKPTPHSSLLTPAGVPRMLLQIHDSILVECHADDAEKVGELMKETMEHVYPELGVKLKVDVDSGKNWGEI